MNIKERMAEIMEPIDTSIQLTDDRNDMLILACAMLQRTTEIFDQTIGVVGRKEMFKDFV